MKEYLFVYGTLLEDFAPKEIAAAQEQLKYVGAGFINGRLYDLGEYPGAVLEPDGRNKVFGKIYELPSDAKILKALDEYEEFFPRKRRQSLFIRKQTSVGRTNKKPIKAWVYEYNRDVRSSPIIRSGDYSKVAA